MKTKPTGRSGNLTNPENRKSPRAGKSPKPGGPVLVDKPAKPGPSVRSGQAAKIVPPDRPGKPVPAQRASSSTDKTKRSSKPAKAPGLSARDERRRQGSLDSGKLEAGFEVKSGPGGVLEMMPLPGSPMLYLPPNPTLEQRVHAWVDVLVYVWRRRTIGERAKFFRNAHLKDDEINALGPAIQQLSRGFTGHRTLVGKTYLDNPDLLGAYLLFYWPVSYAQAWTVMQDQVRQHGAPKLGRVLDLGSGPGPLSCAMIDLAASLARESAESVDEADADQAPAQKNIAIRAFALDHAPAALELLTEIASVAYGADFVANGGLSTKLWSATSLPVKLPVEGSFDMITSGHFINELWTNLAPATARERRTELLTSAIARLNPANKPTASLLVLEPALKPTTRDLLAIRDQLAGGGHRILGPCLFQGNCPALASADGTCHGQVFWELPGLLRRLATSARVSKEELAMAWLSVAPLVPGAGEKPTAADTVTWRVVGEAMLNKAGRTRYMICGSTGRTSLSLKRGELDLPEPKPGEAAPSSTKKRRLQTLETSFFALRRGDLIKLEGAAERESGLGVAVETKITLI